MRIEKNPKKFAFICDNLWDVEDPNDPKIYPTPNQLYRLTDKQQCYMWVGYKDGNDRVHIMPLGAMVLTNSHLHLPLDDDRLFGLYLTDENSGIQARVFIPCLWIPGTSKTVRYRCFKRSCPVHKKQAACEYFRTKE